MKLFLTGIEIPEQVKFSSYGDGNYQTGTPAYNIVVDADGNLMEAALGASTTVTVADEASDTTTFPVFVTTATGSGLELKSNTSFTFNSSTGQLQSTLISAATAFVPDTDDGATLGTTSLKFSDLFLANGGVINWNSSNVTLSHSAGTLTTSGNFITNGTLSTGNIGGTTGQLTFKGTTSGTVNIKVADIAGSYTLTLPTNDGDSGQFLQTDGSGVLTWTAPTISSFTVSSESADSTTYPIFVSDISSGQTLKGNSQLSYDSTTGQLSIVGTAIASPNRESMLKLSISDESVTGLYIDNDSTFVNTFVPVVHGAQDDAGNSAVTIRGTVKTSGESGGSTAAISLVTASVTDVAARWTSPASLTATPILSVRNNTFEVIEVNHDGVMSLMPASSSTRENYFTDEASLLTGTEERLHIQNDGENTVLSLLTASATDSHRPIILLGKHGGTNPAGEATVANGESLGSIQAAGYFGSTAMFDVNASIDFVVNGTVTADTAMPVDIQLKTSPDLQANLATALTVKSTGQVQLNKYVSDAFTGTDYRWLAIDSSGNIIMENPPSASGGGYDTILEEGGAALTQRTTLNFVGSGITAADDAGNSRTNITLSTILNAINDLSTTGIIARTGSGTVSVREITGTTNQITVTNGTGVSGNPTLSLPADVIIPTIITVPNTGLHILDTNASHDLIIAAGSDLTGDRTLTITTGDSNRTLTLTGNATISGTNTGDQTITLTGDVTGSGTGSFVTTLATVNANVGSFGSASQVATFTVNAKGLITAAGSTSISISSTAVSDFTEAAQDAVGGMVNSTLTYVDGTPSLGVTANTTVQKVEVAKNSGAVVGTRKQLNFIEGSNITLTIADDGTNDQVDITIAASGSGGAGSIVIADESADTTCFPLFVTAATGDLGPKSNTGLIFNSSTSQLQSTLISAGTGFIPDTNDGAYLGTSSLQFSDLYLASGAVIDFANNNSRITHSSGVLTVSTGDLQVTTAGTNSASVVTVGGAQTLTSKVLTSATITTGLTPTTDDGAVLGSGSLKFSDLFLANGAVINFNNGASTITHSANTLTIGGSGATTLALGTNSLTMTGSLGTTGARLTKGWFTDLEVTNAIAGSITGNAATVSITTETSDTTCFPLFATATSGSLAPKTNSNFTYNSSTSQTAISSSTSTGDLLNVSNSSTGGGISGTGSSFGVKGSTSSGITSAAVQAFNTNSTDGYGLYASHSGTGGVGVYSLTGGGIPFQGSVNSSTTNTVIPTLALYRVSSGTPSTGIGNAIQFYIERNGATILAAENNYSLTDVSATYTSTYELKLANSGTLESKVSVAGSGQMRLHNYGSTGFTGTATKWLAVDANGYIIQEDEPTGGGSIDGSGTADYIPKWVDTDTLTSSIIRETDVTGTKYIGINGAGVADARLTVYGPIQAYSSATNYSFVDHDGEITLSKSQPYVKFLGYGEVAYYDEWQILLSATDGLTIRPGSTYGLTDNKFTVQDKLTATAFQIDHGTDDVIIGENYTFKINTVAEGDDNKLLTWDSTSKDVTYMDVVDLYGYIDQTPDNGTYGTLSGSVNGTNTVFTVSQGSYISGTLVVYRNGQLQTQGASNDYQETTPGSGTFTFISAPLTGDVITAMYNKTAGASQAPAANDMGVVVHGATAGTARPSGYTVVTWIGSVEPTNATNNDIWVDTSA